MAIDWSWRRIFLAHPGIGGLILAGGLALGWGSLRHVLYAECAEGDRVTVAYDPTNPIRSSIVSFLDLWRRRA